MCLLLDKITYWK